MWNGCIASFPFALQKNQLIICQNILLIHIVKFQQPGEWDIILDGK